MTKNYKLKGKFYIALHIEAFCIYNFTPFLLTGRIVSKLVKFSSGFGKNPEKVILLCYNQRNE
jgi:hypothetical protein